MNGFELQILVFFSGSLYFFCPFFLFLSTISKSLSNPAWSVRVLCVSCTLATCNTPLGTYKPLERDGWEQPDASRPVHAPICALSCGNDREWAALLDLAVLVVSHSSAAAKSKQKLFIIRHPCNRSLDRF